MEGGVTFSEVILAQLRNFEVVPGRVRTPVASIDVAPKDLVRAHARGTSWDAALSITAEKRQRMYKAIYILLSKLGPMTDHELRDEMTKRQFAHSWSGLSARRVELERAGWIKDTGEKRQTQFGKNATVWEAVPEEL